MKYILLLLLICTSITTKSSTSVVIPVTTKSITDCDRENTFNQQVFLLARLMQGEALGEGSLGQLYVGSVVLNRIHKRNQTLEQVIYAKRQFSCINGKLWNRSLNRSCIMNASQLLECGSILPRDIQYFANINIATDTSWIRKIRSRTVFKYKQHTFFK